MYPRNARQKNGTNVILVSFFLSRSSSKSRPKPSQSERSEILKCAICGQYAKSVNQKKSRISKEPRAENLQKAASYFKDEVYIRIAGLDSPSKMFAANLYFYKSCYANCIGKQKRATSSLNKSARTASNIQNQKGNIQELFFFFTKSKNFLYQTSVT